MSTDVERFGANPWAALAACIDCGDAVLPHHREDTPQGVICNADMGKRMRAHRDQETIAGVPNVYYGEQERPGAFSFSVPGGTGAQRKSR